MSAVFDDANGIRVVERAQSFRTLIKGYFFLTGVDIYPFLIRNLVVKWALGFPGASWGVPGRSLGVPWAFLGGVEASLALAVSATDRFVMYARKSYMIL